MDARTKPRIGRWIVLLLLTVLAVTVAGELRCAAADTSSPLGSGADKPVVLRLGWNQMLDSLNPFIGYESVSYEVYHLNYDYLTEADADTLEPTPGLATEWRSSADGKTWTFKLRRGVKWQDGEPFTARDVVFTFDFNIKNDISAYGTYLQGIKQVRALDDYTVEFKTDSPKPGILKMRVPIVPEHIWGKMSVSEATSKFQNPPPIVGTGPFQVVEFKRDKYVRMKANPGYWGGAPKVDEIIFQMYTNNDTLASDLKAGLIQAGNVQPAVFRSFQDQAGLTDSLSTDAGFDELGFNCYDKPESMGNPVLRDPAFRSALNWAIDRQKIATVVYSGAATPATSILPSDYYDPKLDYHWEPAADVAYGFDLEKCRQLLDEAGYSDSDGDGLRENKKGEAIKLRFWPASDKPEYQAAAKFITGWLREVGLGVTMQVYEDGALSDRMYNTANGKFAPDCDLFIWGWVGDFDPAFLLSIFLTSQINGWSDCAWSNAEFDRLYVEQDGALDPQARAATIRRMEEIIYGESPYIPLVYPQSREVYDTGHWQGWVRQPARSGSIWNRYTYLHVGPKTDAAAAGGSGGVSRATVIIIAVAVVVVLAGAVLVWVRRARGRVEVVEE